MALMTGIFTFPPPLLAAYREAVTDEHLGLALEDALETVRSAGPYVVAGEAYKRVPAGYDPHHPRAALLRHAGLYAFAPRIQVSEMLTSDLVERCYAHFQNTAPIYQWLMTIGH